MMGMARERLLPRRHDMKLATKLLGADKGTDAPKLGLEALAVS
jgi:hypothetical protein